MKIATADYLLARFCHTAPRLLRWAGECETKWLAQRLTAVAIERPVFICGLARAGSTMLLELLARLDGVATHRYRDFPFLCTPYSWNKYVARRPAENRATERPHRDGIWITRESPESMEEPLWLAWFPELHSKLGALPFDGSRRYPAFEKFHRDHLRKLLVIREATRYVAKNNYHVTRIPYLSQLYPDAEFVVLLRHPLPHIDSLVRQHRLFSSYATQEPRLAAYLVAAGHCEFGPQRRPVGLELDDAQHVVDCWAGGDDALGYTRQWSAIYAGILDLIDTAAELRRRIHVVRYEDFCAQPQLNFCRLLGCLGLPPLQDPQQLAHIAAAAKASPGQSAASPAVWQEVAAVATRYGYYLDH